MERVQSSKRTKIPWWVQKRAKNDILDVLRKEIRQQGVLGKTEKSKCMWTQKKERTKPSGKT